jgi:shikimate kinase
MAKVGPTVYLTGFMGSGKSAVGRALARRLRRPFIDLDAAVESASGLRVAEIFARRGESAFRRLEGAALARAAGRRAVVALGGGALLNPRNRELVGRTGVLVRLTCARRELARRLRRERAQRPLLAGGSLEVRIAKLLSERRAAYSGADFTVSTTSRTVAAAAAAAARRLS